MVERGHTQLRELGGELASGDSVRRHADRVQQRGEQVRQRCARGRRRDRCAAEHADQRGREERADAHGEQHDAAHLGQRRAIEEPLGLHPQDGNRGGTDHRDHPGTWQVAKPAMRGVAEGDQQPAQPGDGARRQSEPERACTTIVRVAASPGAGDLARERAVLRTGAYPGGEPSPVPVTRVQVGHRERPGVLDGGIGETERSPHAVADQRACEDPQLVCVLGQGVDGAVLGGPPALRVVLEVAPVVLGELGELVGAAPRERDHVNTVVVDEVHPGVPVRYRVEPGAAQVNVQPEVIAVGAEFS
ncbi:hypothetical protein GCM10023321_73260 [Pseudonocardia eucalypti]|uniref:Uncharacterized protein n=1 Tax=Pseudonocardia eucalypti TaxID=648755 RepID=A0ABP9R8V9_9PSEU